MGWSLLHELRDRMEDAYSGWFIGQLASAWGAVVEGPAGLLAKWQLDEVVNQPHFYARHVAPAFDGGAKRVFVVISDAFRFEAAAELVDELNSRNRVKARLDAMLGVLPSYTAQGMASLLPPQRLAYKGNASLDVTVDGQASSTLEKRSAILPTTAPGLRSSVWGLGPLTQHLLAVVQSVAQAPAARNSAIEATRARLTKAIPPRTSISIAP